MRRYHPPVGWKHTALSAVRRIGGLRLVEALYGRSRLTVLAYHRVADPDGEEFVGFRGNVSATPAEFEQQMSWVADRMTPVGIDRVAASLSGADLPDRAVLVTFDDGYRDNLTAATPILEAHGVPATIFLATGHIGTSEPFWWDRVAWRFATSPLREADLPLVGRRSWDDPDRMSSEWITAAKTRPEDDKRAAVARLDEVLGGGPAAAAFGSTLLSWDEVAGMLDRGWSVGAHTCTHPILTRVPTETVATEVGDSVGRVAEATGSPVLGFAYPNGQRDDFDATAREAVAAADVPLAFSLVPGPARPAEVRNDPLAIRRVYVHHGDDPVRFAAKTAGVPRLVGRG